MITSKDFPRVDYQPPRLDDDRPKISNILGIDSEAYTTGVPFMLCTSRGEYFDPKDSPFCFFTDAFWDGLIASHVNFVVWNLKYDSGAILYHLPQTFLHFFWETGKATYEYDDTVYKFQYVPHKLLRISCRKRIVNFWEISQFYRSSLDNAAEIYLNENKLGMTTKNFSLRYVEIHWKLLLRYCIRDADLTARLGIYLVDKLEEFGITASSLYSSASISFKYFCSRTSVVTAWRFWEDDRKALALASDAYEGGKFEVTTRGKFTGIEYDISSAYPYEIANLVDISSATTVHTTEYQPKAVYGFLDCTITHNTPAHIPCGPMVEGVRIYPNGTFRQTITAPEYLYLRSIGINPIVHDAVWFFVKRKRHPYRKIVMDLFKIKSSMKSKDRMLYNIVKVVLNGFYGKMAQSIEQPDGSVLVGSGWNPVYASYITALTRIKVTKIQNLMKSDCLAVHTDSVIVKRPLPPEIPTDNALGNFGFVTEGPGILVACGMYQIGDHPPAFKGFKAKNGETWTSILSRYPRRKTIPYKIIHVESWLEAQAKNHPSSCINVFEKSKKRMVLNCDKKRLWPSPIRAVDLLESQQDSLPKIFMSAT